MKKLAIIALAITLGTVARAAQIGDEVHSFVPLAAPQGIGNNSPIAITSITLDTGKWMIGGLVNIFFLGPHGQIFAGADIRPDTALDFTGGSIFEGQPAGGNTIAGLALPARQFEINSNGTQIFLLAYALFPPGPPTVHAFGWGFISATKIRN